MNKFQSREEAFASQNFNPNEVVITGVTERHLKAALAFINLCVTHDAVNPEFKPDYENNNQRKYENVFELGSPSGVGFSFYVSAGWCSDSAVGSRLVSESGDAARHVAELCHEDYKEMMVYQRETK